MKTIKQISLLITLAWLIACNGSNKKQDPYQKKSKSDKQTEASTEKDDQKSNDINKGIGPVKSVDLSSSIDEAKVAQGKKVFDKLCSACHKMNKKVVGPALSGVTERRSPEWVMNMIMNPEEMIKKDPIAKKLLVEHNMAMMANQNVSREDARAVYEYFRKYDEQ